MPSNKWPKHVPNCSQFSLINSSQRNIFKVEGCSTQNIKLTKPITLRPTTTTKIQSKGLKELNIQKFNPTLPSDLKIYVITSTKNSRPHPQQPNYHHHTQSHPPEDIQTSRKAKASHQPKYPNLIVWSFSLLLFFVKFTSIYHLNCWVFNSLILFKDKNRYGYK